MKSGHTYLLGIGGQVLDASAALLRDGEIVAAAEEERFSRQKFQGMMQAGGLPTKSIEYCLSKAGITIDDVDHICYFFRPWNEFFNQIWLDTKRSLSNPAAGAFYMFQKAEILKAHLKSLKLLQMQRRNGKARVHFVEHHQTHAATCHFLSGEEETAVLVIDAIGEMASTSWYHMQGIRSRQLKRIDYPHSLGMLYAQVTRFCGFKPWSDEYKLMGLASFGEPTYLDQFRKVITLTPGGGYRLDTSYLSPALRGPDLLGEKFYKTFGPARRKDQLVDAHYTNVATSMQRRLEEVALAMAEELHRQTKAETLCVSGGVALNCSMNGKLYLESPFKRILTHNNSGDSGTSLGAALHVWHSVLGNPLPKKIPNHGYLGPSYDNAQILEAIRAAKCESYEECDDATLIEKTATFIRDGEIVGWFQGGMEWGPRALGARSILADATNPAMKDILNKWVKHREEFRPFAPAVLEEDAKDYFEMNGPSPYMTVVYKVREEKRRAIPAVTHVDGTARVQTVSPTDHPRYYQLIKKFKELTGVPVLVNTSFNVMGEPIVCAPEHAIRCFYGTGIDRLVIGNYIITKNPKRV